MNSSVIHFLLIFLLLFFQLQVQHHSAGSQRTEFPQNTLTNSILKRIKHNYWYCSSNPFIKRDEFCYSNINMPKLLGKTNELLIDSCEEIFKFDRWNCNNELRLAILNSTDKVFKETALIYALYSSALAYNVLELCIHEKLHQCKCPKKYHTHGDMFEVIGRDWDTQVCAENENYSQNFARGFLLSEKSWKDPISSILKKNVQFGLKVLKKNVNQVCKCAGGFSKCKKKVCWSQLRPFHYIARDLKEHYYHAQISIINNKISRKQKREGRRQNSLHYLNKSPDLCSTTTARECQNKENCEILCCGRGYGVKSLLQNSSCNCRWKRPEVFELQCETCTTSRDQYFCN